MELYIEDKIVTLSRASGEDLPTVAEEIISILIAENISGNSDPNTRVNLTLPFSLVFPLKGRNLVEKPMNSKENKLFKIGLEILMEAGLRHLYIIVRYMRNCIGLLPYDAPHLTLTLDYGDKSSMEDWEMLLNAIGTKRLKSLIILCSNSKESRNGLTEVLAN